MKIERGHSNRGIYFRFLERNEQKPVIALIMGYAGSSEAWPATFLERLAQQFSVLLRDDRGTGRSMKPSTLEDYSIEIMAEELASVLQKFPDFDQVYLLGYSLGGCIAHEFAHRYPEKLKGLFLVSTTAGGSLYVSPGAETLAKLISLIGSSILELNRWVWELCMSKATVDRLLPELSKLIVVDKNS